MASRLTLHPTAAAAAQALSEEAGGALLPGDSARGFFAFALEMARQVRSFRLPEPAEHLALAWEASQRAGMELRISAAPAFARALSKLHGSGLTVPQLRRLGASDLAAALGAHQQLLTKRSLCDPSAVAWLAAEAASAARVPEAAATIEIAPRIGWTQGELAWIEALAKRAPVTVFLPEDVHRPELFALLDPVHQELARDGSVRLVGPPPGWGGIFAGASRVASPSVEAHSLGSAVDEARAVALRVRALLRSGVAPDAIAVTSLGEPGPEIPSALEAAGIPVPVGAIADSRMLTATLAGQVPLIVLAAAEDGVPRERLCELLESRLLAAREPVAWSRRLREAGSGSHVSARLIPPLEALLRRESKISRDGLAALEGAVERIARLPVQGTIAEHARSLWLLLEELGVLERLRRSPIEKHLPPDPGGARQLSLFEAAAPPGRAFEAPWVEVARSEAAMALAQVTEAFDALVRLDHTSPPITLGEFTMLLRDTFSTTKARTVPVLGGGVAVAPLRALLGRRFSHVFITGLAGDGPPASEDAFLPERLLRSARDLTERPAVLPATGPVASRGEERMAFTLAAGLATEWLWASGARAREGKQLEPSPLLAEVAKAALGGVQIHPLRPWPAKGEGALSRDEVCAALADEPAVMAAEPERAALHRGLGLMRATRDRAILEGRIDVFSGDLTAPDLLPELAARLAFDASRPLSASGLDRLAGCGFRGFADVVLRLKEPEEQDESLDARHKGTFLHACLERAFTALKAANLLPLRGSAHGAEEREVFLTGVREELAAREAAGETGHPVVWGGVRRGLERVLLRVLEATQHADDGFIPDSFEVSFGTGPGSDRPTQELLVDGTPIQLGGTADRIDHGPAASLRVIDYKTGNIEFRNKRLEREFAGRDLQLAHYALILKLAQPELAVDASYFSIYQAKASWALAKVCESAGVTLEDFLDASRAGRARMSDAGKPNLANLVESHVRRARQGQFAVQPGDCGYCKFASGCRVGGLREEWE